MVDSVNKKHQGVHIYPQIPQNLDIYVQNMAGVPSLSNSPFGFEYHAGFHSSHSNISHFDIITPFPLFVSSNCFFKLKNKAISKKVK